MIAAIIIIAVVTGAIAVITAATRTKGQHAAPHGDTHPDPLPGQPADRFSPGVVVPFTPQLGEPLKPLPEPPTVTASSPPIMLRDDRELSDEQAAQIRQRFLHAVKGRPRLIVLPPAAPDADDAFNDVKTMLTEPEPPKHEPLLARYERLIDGRPPQVQELLHYHRDTDEAVNSILQRKLTPDLLAQLDAQKEASDA
jgi:hypothetical protein